MRGPISIRLSRNVLGTYRVDIDVGAFVRTTTTVVINVANTGRLWERNFCGVLNPPIHSGSPLSPSLCIEYLRVSGTVRTNSKASSVLQRVRDSYESGASSRKLHVRLNIVWLCRGSARLNASRAKLFRASHCRRYNAVTVCLRFDLHAARASVTTFVKEGRCITERVRRSL